MNTGNTLECGHHSHLIYGHPSLGERCGICDNYPPAVTAFAKQLTGVVICNDELPFAEAIAADHANPVPRLVFADWLEEQGDLRGELCRVEVELRRHAFDAEGTVRQLVETKWS